MPGTELGKYYVQVLPSAEGITNNLSDLIGGQMSGLGDTAGGLFSNGFGGAVTKAVSSLGLAKVGKEVFQTAADFESGMSKVQAISGVTDDELQKLSENAMSAAKNSVFTTEQATEAYSYMAMAGWKAEDMFDGLVPIMNLAAASGEDLGTTSDIVTDALTAYGLTAKDAGSFSDVLAAASSNANTNVSLMGETFKYVAPVAGAMGYSIEDTAVAIGLMANAGIKGSMAGTSLRTILTNMASPTESVSNAMTKLGVALDDGQGNMYSFAEVMGQLREGFGNLTMPVEEFNAQLAELDSQLESGQITEEEFNAAQEELISQAYGAEGALNAQYAAALAGKTGMSGLLAIVNASDEDFQNLTSAIEGSSGATQTMADVMLDNANGAISLLNSSIDVLFTSLGQSLLPIVTEVVQEITKAVDWFNGLDDSAQKLILTIGGILLVIGPLSSMIGGIGSAVSGVMGIVGSLSSIVSVAGGVIGGVVKAIASGVTGLFGLIAANPVVLAIAAIVAAVVALGVVVVKHWDEIKEGAAAVGEWISEKFHAAIEAIQNAFESIGQWFSDRWQDVKDVFSSVGDWFGEKFQAASEAIQNAWQSVTEFFGEIWSGIQGVFESVGDWFSEKFTEAKELAGEAWSNAKEKFATAYENIQGVFSSVGDWFHEKFTQAKDKAVAAWDNIKEKFSSVWSKIKDAFKIGDALQWGKDLINNFVDGIRSMIHSVVSAVSSVASTVKEYLGFSEPDKGPLSNFHTFGPDMMRLYGDTIRRNIGYVESAVNEAAEATRDGLSLSGADLGYTSRAVPASAAGGAMAGRSFSFTFNSPKALDPAEAAKESKKAAQQLALGYL